LALAITHLNGNDVWNYLPYADEAAAWWLEQSGQVYEDEFSLPPLWILSYDETIVRLKHFPEPWSGLWAMCRWIEADTGYLFADVNPAYRIHIFARLDLGGGDRERIGGGL